MKRTPSWPDVLLLRVEAADDRRDVVHLERPTGRAAGRRPLRDRRTARPACVVAGSSMPATRSRFFRPSVVDCDGVGVADRLGQLAGIGAALIRRSRSAATASSSCCARPLVERLLLVVGRLRAPESACSPTSSPTCRRDRSAESDRRRIDAVLGLRDVVEARVVHERRRVAHRLHPLAIAHLRRPDTASSPSCCAGSRACGRPRARRRTRAAGPSGRRAAAASSRADRAARPARSTSRAPGS